MTIGRIGAIAPHFGQKGRNLMMIKGIGMPVPDGFVVPHEGVAYEEDEVREHFYDTVGEQELFSVRSSPISSMPGVLATIINVGSRFDTPSRDCLDFIREYAYYAEGIDNYRFALLDKQIEDENELYLAYMDCFKKFAKNPFPKSRDEQLFRCIQAVKDSFHSKKAQSYRQAMKIKDPGIGVVVQKMVRGDMNEKSGSGVLFTRNVVTGENKPYGEYLRQGICNEVVSGTGKAKDVSDLKEHLPDAYEELMYCAKKLEICFGDVQDIEFVVEDGRLFIVQVRDAVCSKGALPKICGQLVDEGVATEEQLFHKYGELIEEKSAPQIGELFTQGEIINDGQVEGKIALRSADAERWKREGANVIPVIFDHVSVDIDTLLEASGLIVLGGGRTSHLAVMVKKLGIPCVALSNEVKPTARMSLIAGKQELYNGDHIGMDGQSIVILSQ